MQSWKQIVMKLESGFILRKASRDIDTKYFSETQLNEIEELTKVNSQASEKDRKLIIGIMEFLASRKFVTRFQKATVHRLLKQYRNGERDAVDPEPYNLCRLPDNLYAKEYLNQGCAMSVKELNMQAK